MKKILTGVLICVTLLLVTGCGLLGGSSNEGGFTNTMENKGYDVKDITSDLDDNVVKLAKRSTDSTGKFTVTYMETTDKKYAEGLYSTLKFDIMTKMNDESSFVAKTDENTDKTKVIIKNESHYSILAYKDNVVIFTYGPLANQTTSNDIMSELGY